MQKINYLSTKIFPIFTFLHFARFTSRFPTLPSPSLSTDIQWIIPKNRFQSVPIAALCIQRENLFKNVCTYTIAVAYLTYTIKLLTWVNGGKYWIYLDTKASWPQLYIDTRIYVLVYCWWTNLIDIGIKCIKAN